MLACPAERTKRSRSTQVGAWGLKRRNRLQRTKARSAMPIGAPGWPELAFSTASTASMRSVLTQASRRVGVRIGADTIPPVGRAPPGDGPTLVLLGAPATGGATPRQGVSHTATRPKKGPAASAAAGRQDPPGRVQAGDGRISPV